LEDSVVLLFHREHNACPLSYKFKSCTLMSCTFSQLFCWRFDLATGVGNIGRRLLIEESVIADVALKLNAGCNRLSDTSNTS